MSLINVNDVCDFVNEKTFDEIKSFSKMLYVKEQNDLYLLANNNKNREQNEGTFTDGVDRRQGTFTDGVDRRQGTFTDGVVRRQANGIIFEKGTNKIVAMCYPQIEDVKSAEELNEIISNKDMSVEYCEDGTMIRLYNYNGEWFTSTTKCIDASISFWSSSKSFNELFWDIFDKNDLLNLDKNSTYFFILLHKENRIVVKHKKNSLVYISKINNNNYIEEDTNIFRNNLNIIRKEYIDNDKFISIIKSNEPFDLSNKRGLIIRTRNVEGVANVYKIDFESYKIIKNIRGNVAEIRIRYIELLNKPESLELLEKIYKEYQFTFAFIKASILKLVKTIHRLYINSHVKHEIKVEEDHIYYRTLRQLHAQYKNTNSPIRFEDVYNKVINLDKHVIKRFLNWM
jgi:hypothetical protein